MIRDVHPGSVFFLILDPDPDPEHWLQRKSTFSRSVGCIKENLFPFQIFCIVIFLLFLKFFFYYFFTSTLMYQDKERVLSKKEKKKLAQEPEVKTTEHVQSSRNVGNREAKVILNRKRSVRNRKRNRRNQCCGSGSGIRCLFDPGPGSGIRNRFFPDPGSQPHIFQSYVINFWIKSSIIL